MTVKQGQSFFDKVIQTTGNIENALDMAILNNVSMTDSLEIGSEIQVTGIINERIVNRLNSLNEPATAITQEQINDLNIGIGKMIIGTNFIVA